MIIAVGDLIITITKCLALNAKWRRQYFPLTPSRHLSHLTPTPLAAPPRTRTLFGAARASHVAVGAKEEGRHYSSRASSWSRVAVCKTRGERQVPSVRTWGDPFSLPGSPFLVAINYPVRSQWGPFSSFRPPLARPWVPSHKVALFSLRELV